MKKLIALIAVLLIVGSVLAGCNGDDSSVFADSVDSAELFETIDMYWAYGEKFVIVYQTGTKVMYSVSTNGILTLLVNSDGTPMIYHGE